MYPIREGLFSLTHSRLVIRFFYVHKVIMVRVGCVCCRRMLDLRKDKAMGAAGVRLATTILSSTLDFPVG